MLSEFKSKMLGQQNVGLEFELRREGGNIDKTLYMNDDFVHAL